MLTPTCRAFALPACLAVLGLAAAPLPAAIDRPVYVCRNATPVAYSDRPCGPLAEARVLRIHEPGPGRAPSIEPAPSRAATRPRAEPRVPAGSAGASAATADSRCRQLHEARDRLDERMRAGYSAREAAQLWNRWREVDAKIYAARC